MVVALHEDSFACLSDTERSEFLQIVGSSLKICTQEEFFEWTQTDLQRIFPHGKLACGVGRLGKHGAHVRHVMGCNFPDEYIEALRRPDGLTSSPIIIKWMKEQRPILFEPDCEEIIKSAPPGWLDNFHRFELVNLTAHGVFDPESQTATYFSFSSIPGGLNQHHACLLKLLVPHLHVTLIRVVSNRRFNRKRTLTQQIRLTSREMEVLQWMSGGKSNWEIAHVIGLSESTVKNHVHRILGKLQVGTRAQAVAKAINVKLVSAKL